MDTEAQLRGILMNIQAARAEHPSTEAQDELLASAEEAVQELLNMLAPTIPDEAFTADYVECVNCFKDTGSKDLRVELCRPCFNGLTQAEQKNYWSPPVTPA